VDRCKPLASGGEPNAWPSSETLTHRVKRLADKLGRAVQVDPMKPMLKAPGTKRLKL
jgi:hypothetical protein